MSKKLTILVDMDGIVTDLLQVWLAKINAKFHRNVTIDDVFDWDVESCEKLKDIAKGKVYRMIQRPMFFWDLEPLPGSVNALRVLMQFGHDVKFLTAPASPQSAYEKLLWVEEHFPFIGRKNTIITEHKTLVRGDVLIDDKGSTVEAYKKLYPESLVMTVSYPYNEYLTPESGVKVVGKWDDMGDAWYKALVEIDKYWKAKETTSLAIEHGVIL